MPMTVEEVCLIVQMYFNRVKCRFDMQEQSPPAGDYDSVNTRLQNVTSTSRVYTLKELEIGISFLRLAFFSSSIYGPKWNRIL